MNENYIKCHIVSGVVIKKDGKYLLVQEKKSHVYGLWNWPAGQVEAGDTIESNAVKEAKEETGYDVELIRKLGIFQDNVNEAAKHVFEAKILGGELKFPEDEILDAKWFSFEEIESMKDKLRSNWIIDAINILESQKL